MPIDLTGNEAVLSSTFNSTITAPSENLASQLEAAKLRIAQLSNQLQQEEAESRVLENRAVALSHQISLMAERENTKDAKIEELTGTGNSVHQALNLTIKESNSKPFHLPKSSLKKGGWLKRLTTSRTP